MAVTIAANELHRVVITAIIYRRGKYLLLRRNKNEKAFPGKWTVPGGGLHPDDYVKSPKTFKEQWYFALANTLPREVREETGIEIGEPKYLLDLIFIRPDGVPVIVLSFYAPYKSGTVKIGSDQAAYVWASSKQSRKIDFIDGILQEIELTDLILKGRVGKNADRLKLFMKLHRK